VEVVCNAWSNQQRLLVLYFPHALPVQLQHQVLTRLRCSTSRLTAKVPGPSHVLLNNGV
jgi:hypothetical protein